MHTLKRLLSASLLFMAGSLFAAENPVGAPELLTETGIIPEPMETPMPSFRSMKIPADSFVNLLLVLDEEGYVTEASISDSSDKSLESPVLRAVKKWRYYPAYEDGKRKSCKIIQPIRFNSDLMITSARKKGSRDPKVVARVSPKLNEFEETLNGEVMVRVNLNEKGKITETFISHSTNERLNQAALAAVSQWHFKPAIVDGEAVESKVMVPFHFQGSENTSAVQATASVDKQVNPVYRPEPRLTSEIANIDGRVEIAVTVDASGYVSEAKVLNSSDERLNAVALNTIKRWKFEPAMRDGEAITAQTVQPFVFGRGFDVSSKRKKDDLMEAAQQSLQPSMSSMDGMDGLGLSQIQFSSSED